MHSKSPILTTSADHLMDIMRKKEKISLEELSKELKISPKTVQGLVDFLIEEKILGIEYKFTTPYVYLNKKEKEKKISSVKKETPVLLSKEEFFDKAKARDIPYQKIELLWKKYLEKQLGSVKEQFFSRARKKNLSEEKIEVLWQKYLSYL